MRDRHRSAPRSSRRERVRLAAARRLVALAVVAASVGLAVPAAWADPAASAAGAGAAPGTHAATFRLVDPQARVALLAGDFNGWSATRDTMARAADGSFTRVVPLPAGARVDYKFIVDGRWILDPANPRTCTGGFGPNSEYATPEYIPAPEIARDETIPHGTVETFPFTSALLGNTRRVHVYLPPGYDRHGRYPSILFHDGGEYLTLAHLADILDYGVAMGRLRPLIAICVDPVNRNAEYALDPAFARCVVEELLPRVDSLYATVTGDPALRGSAGASLGGLTSVMLALRYPGIFGAAISQSGAFQVQGGALVQEVRRGPPRTGRFWLDAGTLEGDWGGQPTAQMGEALLAVADSARVTVRYYPEGHSWGNWRAHLLAALGSFWPMIR